MSRITKVSVLAALSVLAAATNANGWSDGFDDNTAEQVWTTAGTSGTTATVANNRYELQAADTIEPISVAFIAATVSQSYTDCTIQARVQKDASHDQYLAYLVARAGAGDGYVMGIAPAVPEGAEGPDYAHIWLGKLTDGAYELSFAPNFPHGLPTFNADDCQAKFSVIGSTLRAKVWTTGTSEPGDWQVTATDSSYASGDAGVMLGTYPPSINDVAVSFDNITATPEPGTLVLLITAGLGALAYAWRRR